LLAALLGLGFVIFVHELGHFLVAKFCGVKVEKFYLGFDFGGLKLWKFRRGETEYGIGVFPLGGYVKMLGQEDNPARLREEIERAKQAAEQPAAPDQPATGKSDAAPSVDVAAAEKALFDPRSYLAKSVPQRMAIISAGVIMNMIFAWIMAMMAFGFGVERIVAGVGQVVPGQGAWKAGLRSGDKIIEIAGKEIRSYEAMKEAIVLGDVDHGVSVVVQRPGEKEPLTFHVETGEVRGMQAIGVLPLQTTELLKEDSARPTLAGTAASKSEPALAGGHKIVKIDDQPIESYAQLRSYLALHPDQRLTLTVERKPDKAGAKRDAPAPADETLSVAIGPEPMLSFGLAMEIGEITAVQKDSPAEAAGIQPGDRLLACDGQPVGDPLTLPDRLRQLGEKTVKLSVQRKGEKGPLELTVKLRADDQYNPPLSKSNPLGVSSLGIAYQVSNKVQAVFSDSPAARAGIQPGDVIESAKLLSPGKEAIRQFREECRNSELDQLDEVAVTLGEEDTRWQYFVMEMLQPSVPGGALPGTTVELHWSRDGEEHSATLEPVPAKDWFNPMRGLLLDVDSLHQQARSFGEAVRLGTKETANATMVVFRSLQKVSSGKVSARNLHGPIDIFKFLIGAAMHGPGMFLLLLTILSANLAVINFLPIPVLDGGHMVFLAYEGIRGKPADERVQLVLTYLGLFFILGLVIFTFGLDLKLIPRP
jgi:regulator of sigma E protease